jgi:UDP-N-acetylglucosamine diphosphorylase/glucosamine-1-phosphate N-acetyltransferase
VHVRAFTRIAGPAYIGRGTTVLGGSLSTVSIGASCKVRGELEETIILGHTNKAHDGFIGHSYIGRWVNLGALTTNSDLKNNYSSVRVWTPSGEQDTGERKIGCFLGDHVKTAIGTLLNTGTIVGPGANLFGTNMPPKHVRPFSWGGGVAVHDLNRFLETARVVMQRRGESLTPGVERLMRALWRETAGEIA